ncbi:MAG: GWxTD domain-containing protein [Acidobacteriaceae bacterium]
MQIFPVILRRHAVVAVLGLLLCPSLIWAAKQPPLPEPYKHWLDEEVPYLITDEERNLFVSLPTNEARDRFIESFWKIRTPDPDSPVNTVREEHYRRLAFANAKFGGPNGWASDRGMVYITLGEPKQRAVYRNTKYLRQMEIWFYESPSSALQSFFYVVFYKPTEAQDYRLYSPYLNKPEALIASTNAVNDEKAAVHIIDSDLGPEVARTVISLLPTEPVDVKDPEPSLQSDTLLNKIRDYRNLPQNLELLAIRRSQVEGVSHRILLNDQFADLAAVATRDSSDLSSIHYLFRFWHPQDFSLARQSDGRYYYSLHLESQLLGPNDKVIYTDTQQLQHIFSQQQVDVIKPKSFGIENRLPAAPGKYQLRVSLTNDLTHQVFSQTRAVVVPAFTTGLGLSRVWFASSQSPIPDSNRAFPFSLSGTKVWPIGSDNTAIPTGTPVRFLVQIWEPQADPSSLSGKKLNVDTLIGRLGLPDKYSDSATIDRASFDADGNLLYGKDLTPALSPGSYRLVVKVTDPETGQSTAEAVNFDFHGPDAFPLWTAHADTFGKHPDNNVNLYRSGLCALAQGDAILAIRYLKPLGETGVETHEALDALSRAYRMAGQTDLASATERRRDTLPAQH